jgi:hypothetical protein
MVVQIAALRHLEQKHPQRRRTLFPGLLKRPRRPRFT